METHDIVKGVGQVVVDNADKNLGYIFSYENIALQISLFFNICELVIIAVLFKGFSKIRDALFNLVLAITTLNERLNKHD